MTEHQLKTDPEVFEAVYTGAKTFEIRLNDRGYQVGDTLVLRETRHTGQQMRMRSLPLEYTGRTVTKTVSHVLSGYGLADHWVCLSFASQQRETQEAADTFLRESVRVLLGKMDAWPDVVKMPEADAVRLRATLQVALSAPQEAGKAECYRVFKDGNAWCAVGPGFIDIQQSLCAFHDESPYRALELLTEAEAEDKRRAYRRAQPQPEPASNGEEDFATWLLAELKSDPHALITSENLGDWIAAFKGEFSSQQREPQEAAEQASIDYTSVQAFAEKHRLGYNECCAMVRAALGMNRE